MPNIEVCSFCIYKQQIADADQTTQEKLAEELQERPCVYVKDGHCAVADFAVDQYFKLEE